MKIILNKNIFLNGVKFSNNIIGQNVIFPILQSILIRAKDNEISLIASNNNTSSIFKIKTKLKIIEEGEVLIKSKTLYNISSKLDNEEILLEKIDSSILKIQSGNFDSNLNIMNIEEYPNISFEKSSSSFLKINKLQVNELFKKVSSSVNNNIEKNSVFNGILLDSETEKNILRIIASDTYKLSFLKYSFYGEKIKILIEPNIFKNIIDFLNNDDLTIYKNNNKLILVFDNIMLSTKNIEGTYPQIEKIINQDYLYNFKINKDILINALNRGISLLNNEFKPIANFKIDNDNILISFKSIEIGFTHENIEIKSKNIKKIELNINALFLISLLKSFENKIIDFYISEINKPILLKDEKDNNFIQIIVPLRKT